MVKLNKIVRAFTHEGARAKRFTPEMELRRALMNCLLWENSSTRTVSRLLTASRHWCRWLPLIASPRSSSRPAR